MSTRTALFWTIIAVLAGLAYGIGTHYAWSHDHDPEVSAWMETLMMPDIPSSRCCGQADAYKVEVIEEGSWTGDGAEWVVAIKDGRQLTFPGGTGMLVHVRPEVPNGLIIHVPANKVTKPKQANPSHSAWIFMNYYAPSLNIFCFVPLLPSF